MATNDPKKLHAAGNPGSGRAEPAPGPNGSSDTFTDMPSATPAQVRGNENRKVDISSADDVDVDKDTPVDDEETPPTSPPNAVSGGG